LTSYGRHWGPHPFRLWSRRWEYPFAADALLRFANEQGAAGARFRVMDAGSGVTFFPYYICSRVPNAEFDCVDYDRTYSAMFNTINRSETALVHFVQATLQKLPMDDRALDAIVCISVLEHTNKYAEIIDEFFRVLRPGGQFVLTFDVSLDGKFTLPLAEAERLLGVIQERFVVEGNLDLLRELSHLHDPGVLTSDHVQATEPELMPWTLPVRVAKAAVDLLKGKGWTTGFRSRTVFCCAVRKPLESA